MGPRVVLQSYQAIPVTLLKSLDNLFHFQLKTVNPCQFPSINGPFPQSQRQTAGFLVRRTVVRLRATRCFP